MQISASYCGHFKDFVEMTVSVSNSVASTKLHLITMNRYKYSNNSKEVFLSSLGAFIQLFPKIFYQYSITLQLSIGT